ncbi:MAG: tryptophan--tRNA ligase [Candidatus Methanospirareceae archaeon]
MLKIDPWGTSDIEDYSRLFIEFGISRFDTLIDKIEKPHRYMRRGIIFAHRGYEEVLEAMNSGRRFAVMSGFMPSGKLHFGGKMVMDEIIWHQRMGGDAFVCIADMEAHSARGVSWEKCKEIGIKEYVLSLIALGFEVGERGHIYFQSENRRLQDLAFELGCEVNFSEISAIYGFEGSVNISHLLSVLMQSADILQPQLVEYGGPKPVVIPVGIDQDPHIRLTRDIASRVRMFRVEKRLDKEQKPYISIRMKSVKPEAMRAMEEIEKRIEERYSLKRYEMHVDVYGEPIIEDAHVCEVEEIVREVEIKYGGYGFFLPASLYHRFMRGLTGGKMSSSNPESYIALSDTPEEASNKVRKAKTGGRVTVEEQKRLGGIPTECLVYELMLFHLIEEDAYIEEIFEECRSGKRLCSSCKKEAAEMIFSFIKAHKEEKERAMEVLKEYEGLREWIREIE